MSTRYVWNKSEVSVSYEKNGYVNSFSPDVHGNIRIKIANSSDLVVPAFSGDSESTSQCSIPSPSSSEGAQVGAPISHIMAPGNAYWIVVSASEFPDFASTLYQAGPTGALISTDFTTDWQVELGYNRNYNVIARRAPGAFVATLSNAASSTYPQDGVSGNYWYTYQGSDNIDAAAVTYSSQEPRGGQPITINVSPSTGNEYGGTVRYTYQVQLAGGAWTTIATNSTATSCQYTIPAGTPTFAARVLASDTWGFSSSDYTTGATLTVINNEPPSAPDGITIGPVLGGEQTTITWGEATDSDGTIASYQLERQIDNGDTWTQIYTGLTRSYDDTINSEWATVNYRVRAVDDDGEAGPYTTGTMQTVNAGWLYFSGPPEDMGDKPAPFSFAFSIGSTTEGTTDISVSVLLDDDSIYTGTPDAGEQVSLEIDTRLSYEGEHTIVVTFEKANLLGDQYVGTYNVPALEIPDGGHAVQFYDSDSGAPVFPNTFARQVFAQRGNSAARLFDRVYSGTYTGTGTSGSSNPLKFRLSFRPKIVAIQAAGASAAAFGLWVQSAADPSAQAQGSMVVYNGSTQSLATVQWDDTNMILSIYAASAAQQLNVSGQLYGIFVGGAMA